MTTSEGWKLMDRPEKNILGKFKYVENEAILHTDESLMPQKKRAWSSWNSISDGEIRIWCTDYTKKEEKMRWADHLGLAVQSQDHVKWVNTKAHK